MMEGHKQVSSAGYDVFTATLKNKTEEMFRVTYEKNGEINHRPFNIYTMKKEIREDFIFASFGIIQPLIVGTKS